MTIPSAPRYAKGEKLTLYAIEKDIIERTHEIKIGDHSIGIEITQTPIAIVTKEIEITIQEVTQHEFKFGKQTLNDHHFAYRAEDKDGISYYFNYTERNEFSGMRTAPMLWSPDPLAWESDLKTANAFSVNGTGPATIEMYISNRGSVSQKTVSVFKKEKGEYTPFTP